ncbi:MAG TPA: DMT family transporter [Pseudonocardiaceae bacterium]|nr:DMT family transporter [Pseudonocardiaceae bacterium]
MAVLLVLLATAVGALALVLLRKAMQDGPTHRVLSPGLLFSLLRHRPLWAVGIAALAVEFCLQVLALANGPVSMVQVLVVLELPFSLILSRLILGGHLHSREWSAVAAMTAGVMVVLVALAPHGGSAAALPATTWSVGLTITASAIVAVLVVGRRSGAGARTASAGTAAGMTAGLVAVLVKPATAVGLAEVPTTWQTWAAVAVSAAAFVLLQHALRAGRLVASQPGITLANPLVATVWGVAAFHEQVRTGWWLFAAALGVALLATGAILLSRSPLLAELQEAPAPRHRVDSLATAGARP